jgi:hypothetical protein
MSSQFNIEKKMGCPSVFGVLVLLSIFLIAGHAHASGGSNGGGGDPLVNLS